MIFLRSLLYAVWFYLTLAVIGLVCMPFAYASRKFAIDATTFWARLQSWGMHWLAGARTEYRGLENLPKGAAIIAMRHQSTYDTIAPFIFVGDPAFVLKRELLKAPVFGVYATKGRMIPIDRGGALKTLKAMLGRAKEEAADGRKIVIFPEGTRQLPDAQADLKPGVIAMYNALGVPCVPVALNTGLCWQGSGFTRRPGLMIFEVLPPIEPGLPRDQFMQRLKDALEPATVKLVAEGRAVQVKHGVVAPVGTGDAKAEAVSAAES
jgi:1-acyl-sn-glycerol-3-phosphate acyltransferase